MIIHHVLPSPTHVSSSGGFRHGWMVGPPLAPQRDPDLRPASAARRIGSRLRAAPGRCSEEEMFPFFMGRKCSIPNIEIPHEIDHL